MITKVAVVTLIVAAGLLSGCSAGGASRPTRPAATASHRCVSELATPVWVVVGDDPFEATLARTDGCAHSPVGDLTRVSTLDANDNSVVVAAAPGSTDQVALVRDGELRPLASGSQPSGFSPTIDPEGNVAFVALGAGQHKPFELVLVSSDGRRRVLLRSADPLLFPVFGPGGKVAVWEQATVPGSMDPAPRGRIAVVDSGHVRRWDVDIDEATGMVWSWGSSQFLLTARRGHGRVVDLVTGRVTGSVPSGWRVVDSRRTDDALLVLRRDRLYTWDRGDDSPGLVRVHFPGPVYDASWSD